MYEKYLCMNYQHAKRFDRRKHSFYKNIYYKHFKRSIHEPYRECLEISRSFLQLLPVLQTLCLEYIMLSGQRLVQLYVLAGLYSTALSGDAIIHTKQGCSHWCQFCNLLQEYENI